MGTIELLLKFKNVSSSLKSSMRDLSYSYSTAIDEGMSKAAKGINKAFDSMKGKLSFSLGAGGKTGGVALGESIKVGMERGAADGAAAIVSASKQAAADIEDEWLGVGTAIHFSQKEMQQFKETQDKMIEAAKLTERAKQTMNIASNLKDAAAQLKAMDEAEEAKKLIDLRKEILQLQDKQKTATGLTAEEAENLNNKLRELKKIELSNQIKGFKDAEDQIKKAKQETTKLKKSWQGVRDFVNNNPITAVFLGGGLWSFVTDTVGAFQTLDKESARLSAAFGGTKAEANSLATSLYKGNLTASMEDVTETMGLLAQEGLAMDGSMKPAADAMLAFKGVVGESAEGVAPYVASLQKQGRDMSEVSAMLAGAVSEWGQKSPQAVAAITKYARATGASSKQVEKGYSTIGGALKKMGATSEEAMEFMSMMYDQDYRKMPPMFQAFAHLRGDAKAFGNAIKPAMSQMQNILRGVPTHLVPAMAESLGISTEIANAMRTGKDYEKAMAEQEGKKRAKDLTELQKKATATVGYVIEEIKRRLQTAIFGELIKSDSGIMKLFTMIGDVVKAIMLPIIRLGGFLIEVFTNTKVLDNFATFFGWIAKLVKGIGDQIDEWWITMQDFYGGGGKKSLGFWSDLGIAIKEIAGILTNPYLLATLAALFVAQKTGVLEKLGQKVLGDKTPKWFSRKKKGGGADAAKTSAAETPAKKGFLGKLAGMPGDMIGGMLDMFTPERGQAIGKFFDGLGAGMVGIIKVGAGVAAVILMVGASIAGAIALIGFAMEGGRGQLFLEFMREVGNQIKSAGKVITEFMIALADSIVKIVDAITKLIMVVRGGAVGIVASALMFVFGGGDAGTLAAGEEGAAPTATAATPTVNSALAGTLAFDASKKADDNQLLMDIRTILSYSLDVERGQLGAMINAGNTEKSKLLLQELEVMRGKK